MLSDPFKDWDCRECQSRKMYLARGCNFFPETIRGDIEYRLAKDISCEACPLSYGKPEHQQYMRYYNLFTAHGVLPEPGGLLDQQNLFLEFVNVVDSTKSAVERQLAAEAKAKQKK
jgi:hypothetical protein